MLIEPGTTRTSGQQVGEQRHVGEQETGGPHDRHGGDRTAALAQAHPEVEDRVEAELVERDGLTGLGRAVTGGEPGGRTRRETVGQHGRGDADDAVEQDGHTRVRSALSYSNRFGADMPVVSDSAVKQMIFNVLDNALEASGAQPAIHLDVTQTDGELVLHCTDQGPGFAPAMLAQLGTQREASAEANISSMARLARSSCG